MKFEHVTSQHKARNCYRHVQHQRWNCNLAAGREQGSTLCSGRKISSRHMAFKPHTLQSQSPGQVYLSLFTSQQRILACRYSSSHFQTRHLMKRSDRLRLKCDGIRAETRFRVSAKRTIPFKSAGRQFSQLLAAEVCASAVVMLDTPCSEVV